MCTCGWMDTYYIYVYMLTFNTYRYICILLRIRIRLSISILFSHFPVMCTYHTDFEKLVHSSEQFMTIDFIISVCDIA